MANVIGSYSTFIDSGGNLSDAIMCCVYLCPDIIIMISSFVIYCRSTPTLMAVILISVQLKRFFAEGPLWFSQYEDKLCEEHWWTNLLYINNFYPGHIDDEVNSRESVFQAGPLCMYIVNLRIHELRIHE